ncbi:MAG: potassium/proton antiporter [Odoribacteraceae bacterium]|jgi:cell volume regulation protein A|nr:potassium/proton antiporter [Odoribacteraceae bacterium]
MTNPEHVLLIGSILLLVSIVVSKAGFRFGVPVLLLFLGVGMLFGNDGLDLINFHDFRATQFIGIIALNIILFSGGMDTRTSEIKPVAGQGVILATFGVLVTALITGYFIYFITGLIPGFITLTFPESLLLAAVLSSTDSASVFAILRTKKQELKNNLRPMLELESGSNDPMAYLLTIIMIQVIQSGDFSVGRLCFDICLQMSIGAAAGYLLGRLIILLMNNININQALYPVLLLTCVFATFSITGLLRGNGYLAVYLAGLVVGNHKVVHKKSMMTFFEGFTWLFQIVIFLTLGLLVNPSKLGSVASLGIFVGLFMILVSRPAAVLLSLVPFRQMTTRARLFVSWVGLRGAVPIIFATYPIIAGVEHADLIFNAVFFVCILSLVIQGTTVTTMGKWLHLTKPASKPTDFNVELPEEIKAAMSEIEVIPSMMTNGHLLMNLHLPDNTLVVMIKRGKTYCVPKGKTSLQIGDKLLVITDDDEELRKTYESLGIEEYSMRKNI